MRQTVGLDLTGPCNYSCSYCIGDGPVNKYPAPTLHDLGKIRAWYAVLAPRGHVTTTIYARGTEPALHPQMSEIATICAPAGLLHISTNLSRPVGEWLSGPTGLLLLATIHPEAAADIAGFMGRVRDAVAQGYHLRVQMLGDEDQPDWRARLADAGVTEPFKVLRIRSGSAHAVESAQVPQPKCGSLCRGGYDVFYIAYSDGAHPVSFTTRLTRCQVSAQPIDTPLNQPGACFKPLADTRCQAYLIQE